MQCTLYYFLFQIETIVCQIHSASHNELIAVIFKLINSMLEMLTDGQTQINKSENSLGVY